jgi:D-alanine-D-alanine ligase
MRALFRGATGHTNSGVFHLRAVLLVDEEMYDANDPDFSNHVPRKFYDAEFHVSATLRRIGHRVLAIPATADLGRLIEAIKAARPHVVFNLVEHIGGNRTQDFLIPALLEVEGIPYTGASAAALMNARDKQLSKLIVANAGVAVPKSFVAKNIAEARLVRPRFPLVVKPSGQDGSEGIHADSYVTNVRQYLRQVARVNKEFTHPAICEEYIEGRELIVTLFGIDKISVGSIRELVFPDSAPVKFATELVKFDDRYKQRHGIHYRNPTRLIASFKGEVERIARVAYAALGIESYAKLEFRVRNREVVFIEANPNSNISRRAATTDFGLIGYEKFIKQMIRMAFTRHARRRA